MIMNTVASLGSRMKSLHAPIWLDFLRAIVGVFIVIKGYQFTANFESITQIVGSMGMVLLAAQLAYYIVFAHLIGGALIALGAYTRPMSLLNIPILLGAVIFNARSFLTMDDFMELPIAIGVLIVLIVVSFYGGGKYSLDAILRNRQKKK